MDGIEIWIGIGSLIVAVVALLLDRIRHKKKINALAEMILLYRKEVELLQKSLPRQLALQKEWINLQKQINEAEDRREWAKLIGGALKYITENDY